MSDVRVVDRTRGLAGAYCVQLLAGTGAGVHREPDTPSDLPESLDVLLRPPRTAPPGGRAVVVDDACPGTAGVAAIHHADPDAVVVTISPFGLDGPWARMPANEFTLQAWCGSTGGRGEPDRPPVQAAGRLLEWAAGTYAAVGALAALRRTTGEHVDVSVLETGVLVANTYTYLAKAFGDEQLGAARSVEVPSILPAADGYVGVATITAQQFEDFLVMVDRPDLVADESLRSAPQRFARRHEFLEAVHAWSRQHTVAEILERASVFRVPAAPVLQGDEPLHVPHFVEREVFQPGPGRLCVPRRPYRVRAAGPARPVSPSDDLPLSGVRVIDLTAFLAGPSATHVLAALGADVVKVEGPKRPDGMRGVTARRDSADWLEWGPIFHGVNSNKRGVAIDLAHERGRALLLRLVARAHAVVENFTPRVLDNLRLTYEDLLAANPGVILVRMPAYGLDGPWRDRSGFAQNMEQVSGLAALTGYPEEHPILPRGPCDPIAGMHAVVALLDALSRNQAAMVEVPMVEAILNVAVQSLVEAQTTGQPPARLGNRSAAAAPQGVYRAAGDDSWLALSVEDDTQWQATARVLGVDGGAFATAADRLCRHDDLDEVLRPLIAGRKADELARALLAEGVPAAPVVTPRDVAAHAQLQARGFFEELEHPVAGRHAFPTVPFRLRSRTSPWLTRAAPLLGEHTAEVLRDAGVPDEEVDELREMGVIVVG